MTAHLFSNLPKYARDETDEYEEVRHYLLDTKTGQVKRWIDKDDAPLVARQRVRFGPDHITWAYDDDSDATQNVMSLDRATLQISGSKLSKGSVPGVGGYFQQIAISGQCKKTSIPWGRIKTNQV